MKKIKNLILLGFLAIILPFTSLASEGEKPSENKDQKLGEKIIMTEDVKPQQAKPSENKEGPGPAKNEDEKKSDPQKTEVKSDESDPKKVDGKSETNNVKNDNKDYDIKSIEKAVDELVKKLDEDSDLTKALTDVKKTINTENGEKQKATDKKTENIIKDYSEKIEKAKTPSQKKKLENEAADKIKSINNDRTDIEKIEDNKNNQTFSEKEEELSENDRKKDKLVIEVKSDNENDEIDREKIYALATDEEDEEENLISKNPIIFITLTLILAILVAIGLAIRKRDKKDLD